MPTLEVLRKDTQTVTSSAQAVNGDAVFTEKAKTIGVQCSVTVDTPSAKTFIAGVAQVQQVATVADSSGSLNSTYFLLNSINTTTGASKGFYVWFNINSAGVDPAVAGRTAIPITGATNVSANDLATSIRAALDALTSDFASSTGSNQNVIVNNKNPGPVTAAADGAAATGFTFSTPSTAGVASKVSPQNDTISITAHGLPSGLVGQLSSTGTLPVGFATSTNYFVIVVDANTIKLASSLANAIAGTAVDIDGYGTLGSTHTFTPTAIASATVTLQKSMDGSIWAAEGSAVSITATAVLWLEKVDSSAIYNRLAFALASGSISVSSVILQKGYVD